MSRSYKFIDHTADIAAELEGSSFEELFISGADAWLNSVVDGAIFESNDSTEIDLKGSTIEELLVTFLNELNYLLLTQNWLCLSVQSIKIFDDENGCELSAELDGTKLEKNIQLKHEIKSVTYHQVEIVKNDDTYKTLVVFDI